MKLENYDKYFNVDRRVIGFEALDNPRSEQTSSNRQAMSASQAKQASICHGSEVPRYLSGAEVEICEYLLSPTRIEKPSTLITFVQKPLSLKNSSLASYTIIYFTNDDMTVNFCDIDNYTVLGQTASDNFGYQNIVQPTTNLLLSGRGTYIPAGTEFITSPSIKNGIYSMGINAKTIYTGSEELVNDSFIISQDLAEKMESTGFMTFKIALDENSFPLNLFGTIDDYRCLPEPGEEIDGDILFAFRNSNELTCVSDLTSGALRKVNYLHDNLYSIPEGASIIDIKVWIDPSKLKQLKKREFKRFSQLYTIHELYTDYYKKLIKEYRMLLNQGYEISNDFNALITHAMGMTSFNRLANKDYQISFIEFEVTVAFPRHVNSGNKLTCRMASKGVIASGGIWPTENMPVTESGIRADLIVADNSPFNRLNIGQWYEQFINYAADIVRQRILNGMFTDVDEAYSYILAFKEVIDLKDKDTMDEFITPFPNLRKEYVESLKNHPIYIVSPQFSKNANPRVFKELREKFGIQKENWSYIHPITNERIYSKYPTIIGDKYIYLLGKLPDKEVHAVEIGYLNQIGLPMKESSLTKQQSMISNTPIRFGVDEIAVMSATVSNIDLSRFLCLNSNSLIAIRELQRRLSTDSSPTQLYKIDMSTREMLNSSISVSIFNHMLACCGRSLTGERKSDPMATVDINPGKVINHRRKKELVVLDDVPHITKIEFNNEEIVLFSLLNFDVVKNIMEKKLDSGFMRITFSDKSICKMPARIGLLHLIFWEIYIYFNIIPSKKDIFNIKYIKKSFVSSTYTRIYKRLCKVDYYMFVLERLWVNINYLNKFNRRYCAEYISTLCGIDLAEIVEQEEFQKILKEVPDESMPIKNAEAKLKFLTDELISKLKSQEIKNNLQPFIETDSLNIKQIGQALIAYGPRDDIDNTMPRYIVKESCFEGLKSIESVAIESLSVKKSQQYNKSSMRTAGAFQKEFRGIAESQGQLYLNSCGNTDTITIYLKSEWKDNFIDRVIVVDDKRVLLSYMNIDEYINSDIQLVSPVMCDHEFGICENCSGYGEEGILKYFIAPGVNIGKAAACIVGESILQKILSSKHLIEMNSIVYNLPLSATGYMEKSGGGISWRKSIKPQLQYFSMQLSFDHNSFGEFDDLKYSIKDASSWSSIQKIKLIDDKGEVICDFNLSDDIIVPYLSPAFLKYMKSIYDEIYFNKDNITIPLKTCDPNIIPLRYKVINQDMNAYVNEVKKFFITEIRNFKNADALTKAYSLVYKKSDVPSFYIDLVVKAFRSEKINGKVTFKEGPVILSNRDVPSKLRHNRIHAYLTKMETYLSEKRPSFVDSFFGF